MLKINTNFKKYKILLIAATAVLGGIFLFQYLTFIPEYSSAMVINTPVYSGDEPKTLSSVVNMQDVTAEVCGASNVGETKRLRDRRDYTWYWVTKMKDGNCWMTQNLALDLDANTWLTPDTSDVEESWQPTDSTLSGSIRGQWRDGKNRVQSWNPGEYVYTTPDTRYTCGTSLAGLYACNVNSWQEVSEWTASDDPKMTSVIDTANKIYDAHYLSGNYYSYAAATAGSGVGLISEDTIAQNSICPKGWKLPLSGDKNNNEMSYYRLMNAYGLDGILSNAEYDVRMIPLYFVYSGYIDSSGLEHPGQRGDYYSSVPVSDTEVYFMSITNEIKSSNQNLRSYGMAVRCVAYGSDDVKIPEIPNPNVSITVDKILTMELDSKEVNIEPKTNEIMTGNFTATVSSNAGYDIQLSTTEDGNAALVNKKDNVVVAEIPASNNIQVGTNGWGIKCIDDNDNCIIKNYNALTLYNNPQVYFSSTNAVTNKPTHFEVSISISPSLPSGTYSTNILVTANQK